MTETPLTAADAEIAARILEAWKQKGWGEYKAVINRWPEKATAMLTAARRLLTADAPTRGWNAGIQAAHAAFYEEWHNNNGRNPDASMAAKIAASIRALADHPPAEFPPPPLVEEVERLREALKAYDHLSLVFHSAVRQSDPSNLDETVLCIKSGRAALNPAPREGEGT